MIGRRALIVNVLGFVLLVLVAGMHAMTSVAGAPHRSSAESTTIALGSVQDNTLYQENDLLSNGQGQYFFAGATAESFLRRGLLKFDIANNLPPEALIVSATLRLHVSKSPSHGAKAEQFTLHRLLADWGEGASAAPDDEGEGTAAEEGDATWSYSFYSITPTNLISWTSPGGDFIPSASASTVVGVTNDDYYYWQTSPGMISDLKHWLRSPDNNQGWLLKGNESEERTARRFDSRENDVTSNRPILYVEYVTVRSRNYLPLIVGD